MVGVAEAGGQFQSWLRRLATQLLAATIHVPRGVYDPVFFVMDPVGKPISVSLQNCRDYQTPDDILKGYLRRLPQSGGRYIERGDYSIVSEDANFVVRKEFAETVKAYMLLEIRILQRQVQKRSATLQNNACQAVVVHRQPQETGGSSVPPARETIEWMGKSQDVEKTMSPQMAFQDSEDLNWKPRSDFGPTQPNPPAFSEASFVHVDVLLVAV
ncbi:hypothetical protein B0H11DRAFT_2295953 [Mycena galericulata]|nr:hypothetical protein B0H11DRAFT_2295953 [Mycena galericulata]